MPRKKSTPEPEERGPMVTRGIIALLLVIFAIIIILSFFDAAGPVGFTLNRGLLTFLMGSLRFLAPIIVFGVASLMIHDPDGEPRFSGLQIFGAFLFLVALSGLFHMRFDASEMWFHVLDGTQIGGGALGMIAWPLKAYTGGIATTLILAGLLFISLVFMVNELITHYVGAHRKVVSGLGGVRGIFAKRESVDDDEEDEDEEHDDDEDDDLFAEQDDEEDEEDMPKRRFFSRRMRNVEEDEDEEDGEDDTEDEEEEESEHDDENEEEDEGDVEEEHEDEPAPTPAKQSGELAHTSAAAGPWAQNVIIKDTPPVDLLTTKKTKPTSGDLKSNAKVIKDTLAEFNINVDMGEARVGPTVTQYTFKPRKGVKLSRITSLSKDLALALAARTIRIEAPIPGKSLVGIEVPNEKTAMVTFKELLESKEFKSRDHDMMIGLGKDVGGKIWWADLPSMPHLLVAGTTGSGKTVCVNTIILSLLYQNTAETLRMIMVDPKRVELTLYNGIPHLLTPVITNTQQTVNALKWCIGEMERRFEMLQSVGNRDIKSYNKAHPNDKIPYIVFVIDELADLMATAAGEVEAGIIRLAQMARAVGIHLVVATQRPSVDVITGLMKANIPGRVAFSVASSVDSRTILDSPGAEKLLGKGDMLLSTAALGQPVRIQGAFVSEEELKGVVEYLKGDDVPQYDESIISKGGGSGTANLFGGPSDDQDPLFIEAKRAVIEAGKASASFLQRKLKVGYARAARILDEMEAAGIIGPADGAKPREILAGEEQLDNTPTAAPRSTTVFVPTPPPVKVVDLEEETEESEEDEDQDDDDYPELEEEDEEDIDDEEEYEEEEEEEEEEDEDEMEEDDDEIDEDDEEEYDEDEEDVDEEEEDSEDTVRYRI